MKDTLTPLPRKFHERNTLDVARDLLGKYMIYNSTACRKVGMIVEAEAYRGVEDLACHAAWKRREKCEVLWGEAGHLYVYLTYGMYWMINVATEEKDFPSAVLLRALEPVEGIEGATNGPGRLSRSLGITGQFNNLDVTGNVLYFADNGYRPERIVETTRIGVEYAKEWAKKPWRFYIDGNRYVSRLVKKEKTL